MLDDFNRIIDDFTAWYGSDQIAFLKIDGQIVYELSQRYSVMSFPTFLVIAPNSGAEIKSQFRHPQRNYETLKDWLIEIIGDSLTLVTTDPKILEELDSKSLTKLWDEMQLVMSDKQIRESDTQDVAFIDVMRSVSEQTIKENRKLEGLVRQIELLKKAGEMPEEEEEQEWGKTTIFMMGLIAGGVASIAMVIYVNVNAQPNNSKNQKNHGQREKKERKEHS